MLATLTGMGLSSAAGLNAYIPLLVVGLLGRYTDLLPLGQSWQWLEHPVVLVVLGALLAVELVADKIPALDSLNDLLQTLVRPTSGGITFGAGTSTVGVDELAAASSGEASWWPIAAGAAIALGFHVLKALARPVVNTLTLGIGGPLVSTAEDAASVITSLVAVLVPVLVALVLPLLLFAGLWALRRRRRARHGSAGGHRPPAAAESTPS